MNSSYIHNINFRNIMWKEQVLDDYILSDTNFIKLKTNQMKTTYYSGYK